MSPSMVSLTLTKDKDFSRRIFLSLVSTGNQYRQTRRRCPNRVQKSSGELRQEENRHRWSRWSLYLAKVRSRKRKSQKLAWILTTTKQLELQLPL